MTKPRFEILDYVDTALGPLCLRRRDLLGMPGVTVTEVSLDHELLMSSLNTTSERELATRATAWHGGDGLRVMVGGLGLGYTAQAALDTGKAAHVDVVELLPDVIRWFRDGLVPLANLAHDPQVALIEGDAYGELLGPPPAEPWDLILIDVDHSPSERLDPTTSKPFYAGEGLVRVYEHLAPGGVLAVWSVSDDPAFVAALGAVFCEVTSERVAWVNDLVGDGQEVEDTLFLARRTRLESGGSTERPALKPGTLFD